MERERIPVSEIVIHNSIYDELNGFSFIEDHEKDFDSEKGFVDKVVIIQRDSDSKFFRVIYTDYGHGNNSLLEEEAEEVFPEVITTTIYK